MSFTKHPSPATFALIASAVLLLAVLPLLVPGQAMAARTTVFPLIIDFEGGLPSNWLQFNGPESTIDVVTRVVGDADPDALPGQIGDNEILTGTVSASKIVDGP